MTTGEHTTRLRIALVFGGRSREHDVSIVSARSIHRALDPARYDVVAMAIDRDGRWADPDTARRVLAESTDRADGAVEFAGVSRLDPRLVHETFDVAFPALHGPFGEDGTVQGLFEILDIPYVGSDTAASALCMDKIFCKRTIAQAGLPTPDWVEVTRSSWTEAQPDTQRQCLTLGLPLFVKPARLGSSVGISKVKTSDELAEAVDEALSHGPRALVEKGVDAREIEVAVLGNSNPKASLPGEIVPGHEFYDYDDKYLDSTCQLLAPAPLEPTVTENAQHLAVAVFKLLGCAGMARVDLFLDRGDGRLWINEVNTIPGFTSISMYPRLWGLAGLDYPSLVDELVRLALTR